MRIFTPCWGKSHFELLRSALGKSLSWPKNKKEIEGAEWIFITDTEEEADETKRFVDSFGIPFRHVAYIAEGISRQGVDCGIILLEPLLITIDHCLRDHDPLLMATPDFIYADGTISAFKEVAYEKGSCASIAHVRALPEITNGITFDPPTNAELLTKALKHPHCSWTGSQVNHPESRFYRGGVQWKRHGDLYSVRHWMPSPFFCNFIQEDLDHFKEMDNGLPPAFGMWDHLWPSHLIRENRLRFIGGSDLALMVEVTDADKNVPPVNKTNEDGFFLNKFHNQIQSQFVSVFRAQGG